jgi:hypothetical protein
MRLLLFIAPLIVCLVCFASCEKSETQKPAVQDEVNYESLVQEKDSPLLFMDVEAKIKVLDTEGNKKSRVVYGTISNTAMQTKFKDVTLAIKYYSRENDLIESSEVIIYKFYEPNTRTKFEVQVNAPDSMQTIEVEIKDAKAAGK